MLRWTQRLRVPAAATGAAAAAATSSSPRALTKETQTRVVSNKYVRRPKEVQLLRQRRRARARRTERTAMLYAKTQSSVTTLLQETTNARDVVMAQLADHVFSKGHWYMGCATNIAHVPEGNPAMPLVALAGRERVGKTSLLRSLFRSASVVSRANRHLRRDAMNYFNVGDVFNVVDLPGYGGTAVPWSTVLQHAVLLRNLARCQPSLKMLYYCMDVHYVHGVYVQDIDMLRFLASEVPNFTIVLTKAEQLHDTAVDAAPLPRAHTRGDKGALHSHVSIADVQQELLHHDIRHPMLVTSAYRMGGIDTLRYDMVMNCLHALPTERLTYTEARRLSQRLFTLDELRTVRELPTPPTALDDALHEWHAELAAERRQLQHEQQEDEQQKTKEGATEDAVEPASSTTATPATSSAAAADALAVTTDGDDTAAAAAAATARAYARLCKTAGNAELLQYVRQTSPWRNPLTWPPHVVPTRHPKANIMRCPGDMHNPYLTQPRFVAPRADMHFRRPNVGARAYARKGRYVADPSRARAYTLPHFPDIIDVDMHPAPWTFLGSREDYYERSHGRALGVRLLRQATWGQIDALAHTPAPHDDELTRELHALEAAQQARLCSGDSDSGRAKSNDDGDKSQLVAAATTMSPIAMLRPPDDEGDDGGGGGASDEAATRS